MLGKKLSRECERGMVSFPFCGQMVRVALLTVLCPWAGLTGAAEVDKIVVEPERPIPDEVVAMGLKLERLMIPRVD